MHIPRNKFSILGLLFRKLSLPHMQNCLHILLHELKILESTLQGSPTRSSTGLSFLNVFLVVPLSAFRITSSFFFFFIAGLPSYSSNPLLIFQSCSQNNFSSFFFLSYRQNYFSGMLASFVIPLPQTWWLWFTPSNVHKLKLLTGGPLGSGQSLLLCHHLRASPYAFTL